MCTWLCCWRIMCLQTIAHNQRQQCESSILMHENNWLANVPLWYQLDRNFAAGASINQKLLNGNYNSLTTELPVLEWSCACGWDASQTNSAVLCFWWCDLHRLEITSFMYHSNAMSHVLQVQQQSMMLRRWCTNTPATHSIILTHCPSWRKMWPSFCWFAANTATLATGGSGTKSTLLPRHQY